MLYKVVVAPRRVILSFEMHKQVRGLLGEDERTKKQKSLVVEAYAVEELPGAPHGEECWVLNTQGCKGNALN